MHGPHEGQKGRKTNTPDTNETDLTQRTSYLITKRQDVARGQKSYRRNRQNSHKPPRSTKSTHLMLILEGRILRNGGKHRSRRPPITQPSRVGMVGHAPWRRPRLAFELLKQVPLRRVGETLEEFLEFIVEFPVVRIRLLGRKKERTEGKRANDETRSRNKKIIKQQALYDADEDVDMHVILKI